MSVGCVPPWAFALCVLLNAASGCSTSEQRALTRAELLDPESCKDCHPKHYAEWSSSMHAYAMLDPVFLAMNRRGQEEAQLGAFCVNCHAPMAVREKAITDFADLSSVPKHLQGVTCYFCHNAMGVMEPHNNAQIQLADDTIMRAALSRPVRPYAHDVGYSIYHDASKLESSLMCGTCHDVVTPGGFHLEKTLDEYKRSVAARPGFGFQSCQDCHMRRSQYAMPAAEYEGVGARTTHSHLWPAVDVALTPDFPNQPAMRSAVERCELENSISYFELDAGESLPGEPYTFSLLIETNAGHAMPSGAAQDRRMWVELVAYDASGREVLRTGDIPEGRVEELPPGTPGHDPNLCIFRDRVYDAQGEVAHMFWQAVSRDEPERVLPPSINAEQRHWAECAYATSSGASAPPARMEIKVRMRPMGIDVLQELVKSGHLDPVHIAAMPTFTVTHREATYDATSRGYRIRSLSQPDCDESRCMLDPRAPGCAP